MYQPSVCRQRWTVRDGQGGDRTAPDQEGYSMLQEAEVALASICHL